MTYSVWIRLSKSIITMRKFTNVFSFFSSTLTGAGSIQQLNAEQYKKINESLSDVKLPIVEYLTVPLDDGMGK